MAAVCLRRWSMQSSMKPSMKPKKLSAQKPMFPRAACAIALSVAMSGLLSGQQVTITVNPSTPDFGRPVYDAIQQLQNLTTIPINYEDLQYTFAGDVRDVSSLMTPTQQAAGIPGVKVLVPKGGSFSVNVPVDPATGKLADAFGVSNALNAVIAAAQAAGIVPGTFSVDSSQPGAFFVEPARQHDSKGSSMAAQAALATPITVSFQQTVAQQVLDAIFQQVAQKTGVKFQAGSGTLVLARPLSKVSITASNEPAKYVLARLLAAAYNMKLGTPPGVSYVALFEPQQRYYVFNMQVDAAALPPPTPPSPPQQPPATGQRLGKKGK